MARIAPLNAKYFYNRKGLHSQLLAGSPLDRELRSRLPDGAEKKKGSKRKREKGVSHIFSRSVKILTPFSSINKQQCPNLVIFIFLKIQIYLNLQAQKFLL